MSDFCPRERVEKERPVTRQSLDLMNRRGFVGTLLAASASLALASLPLAAKALAEDAGGTAQKPGPKVPLTRVADLPEGKAMNFSYPDSDHPAILVHLPSGEFRAYHVECTHLGCPVYWDAPSARLKCP